MSKIQLTYIQRRAYTAKLTVTDDKGATNTATATVTVQRKKITV